MSDITAAAIASLRTRTGVSISACKEALVEANGDEEKAIEILRKRGIAQAAKKAARAQAEGLVFLKEEGNRSAMLVIRCETDFVARDDSFQSIGEEIVGALLQSGTASAEAIAAEKLPELVQRLGENITAEDLQLIEAPVVGSYLHSNRKIGVIIGMNGGSRDMARDIAMHAAALNPMYLSPDDVTADVLEKEREIWREQMKKEGKPEAIQEKIMIGKEKKFREENALLKQAFVKDPTKTIEQYLNGVTITAYSRISIT